MNRSERRKMQKVLQKHNLKFAGRKSVDLNDIYVDPNIMSLNPMFKPELYIESIMNQNFDFTVNETCSLCGTEIKDFRDSHNPYPLAKKTTDRCCSACNNSVVLDARLSEIEKY